MNCSDWQMQIAAEAEDPAIAEHLAGCEHCRRFVHDLAENAVALRSIEIDPAAYAAVRARVLSAVRPRRSFACLWAAVATAAACLVVYVWAALFQGSAPPPSVVAYKVRAPAATAPLRSRLGSEPRASASGIQQIHRTRVRHATHKEPLTAIKLLTDDPNVVIIWLVDKKGD